jgi:hypothetical protein
MAKWNEALRIEETLGGSATLARPFVLNFSGRLVPVLASS